MMQQGFDPYHAWLGIPPEEQPPTHYRLLGILAFENDPKVIQAAADERTGSLHGHEAGEHAQAALRLLNEVAVARVCLLNPQRKKAYDRGLRQRLDQRAAGVEAMQERQRAQAGAFLDLLQERELLPPAMLKTLRQQVQHKPEPVPSTAIAQRLIEAGELTPALARRLLAASAAAVAERRSEAPLAPAEPAARGPVGGDADDDLGFAPLEDEVPQGRRPPPLESTDDLEELLAPERSTAPSAASNQDAPRPKPAGSGQGASAAPARTAQVDTSADLLSDANAPGASDLWDDLLNDGSADAGSPVVLTSRRRGLRALFARRPQLGPKKNVWDSPLLLIGGGALLGLLLLFVVLLFSVSRQTGDKALALAHEDYQAGLYTQAISKYNQYLDKFPDHGGAGQARVNRGLAQLRQATAPGTSDWSVALEEAKLVLGEIPAEDEFRTAYNDLSTMLTDVAAGLAENAWQQKDAAQVASAREALALVDKYVPKSFRREQQLTQIVDKLAKTEHDIARSRQLEQALAEIDSAVGQREPQRAYEARKALLARYPSLIDEPRLRESVKQASQAERELVRTVAREQATLAQASMDHAAAALTFSRVDLENPSPDGEGHTLFVQADGAVYGLDAARGKVRWRRFVGYSSRVSGPGFAPLPLSERPGSDALLVHPGRDELLRLEAATGKTVWRHPIGQRFDAHPVVAGDRVFVATRGGRLVQVDTASGRSDRYIQLPQAVKVTPAVDQARGAVFLAADLFNLYVLGLDDGACRQVVHLGHEQGSITAPPAVAGSLVLVAINSKAQNATLHVFAMTDDQGRLSEEPVQTIRLKGRVDTPPSVVGRRVLVTTDVGGLAVYEISGDSGSEALRLVAKRDAPMQEPLIRFATLDANGFWLTDRGLTRYEIRSSLGQLAPERTLASHSTFSQPPIQIGRTLFHVRRQEGAPGMIAVAVSMDGTTRYWETQLAAPLAGEPLADPASQRIRAVTSDGGLYEFDSRTMASQAVLDEPVVTLQIAQIGQPIRHTLPFDDGVMALAADRGSTQIAVFNPKQRPIRFRWLILPDPLACRPVRWGKSLLAPTESGQVYLLDPSSGQAAAEPFQPRVPAGQKIDWQPPAITADDKAVLADSKGPMYRIGVVDQPRPHLEALAEHVLPGEIISPVASAGKFACAVDGTFLMHVLQIADWKRLNGQALTGRPVWGPARVGPHVLVATDDGRLWCIGDKGQLLWNQPLLYGTLAGMPLWQSGTYLLGGADGVVWRADAATGKELGKIELGCPLGSGPVVLGTRLLVAGHDGSLYVVEQP